MHPLLRRQLDKQGLTEGEPPSAAAWAKLLSRIGETYAEHETERYLRVRGQEIAERELQKSATRLEAARDAALMATRAKSEFLANMSHEIRTPLNGVIGMLELMFRTKLDAEQCEYAQTARTSAELLLHVLNDILDFSKMEAGKMELECIDFDLRKLAEEVAEIMSPKAAQNGVELVVSFDAAVPTWVRGDPSRLSQMLLNLTSNAIKFTSHGEVVIEVRIEDGATLGPSHLRLSVRDTGLGIPPDRLAALFRPFTQVDASTTRKFGGTGLGLAITRELATRMGGRVEVDSVVGKGSEFSLHIPFERSATDAASREAAPRFDGLRALLVEPNETLRGVLSRALEGWGVAVVACENDGVALSRLQASRDATSPFDVVISNKDSAALRSAALVERPQTAADTARPAFILTTTESKERREPNAGFVAVLTKPVKLAHLEGAVRSCMPGAPVVAPKACPEDPLPSLPRGLEVLVVEDNPVNQRVVQILLQKISARVDVVGNGAEAVARCHARTYDIILMDCQMPIMDGFEATRVIRENETKGSRMPIIALTANASESDRKCCIDADMDGHVSKPFKATELYTMIQRHVRVDPVDAARTHGARSA